MTSLFIVFYSLLFVHYYLFLYEELGIENKGSVFLGSF